MSINWNKYASTILMILSVIVGSESWQLFTNYYVMHRIDMEIVKLEQEFFGEIDTSKIDVPNRIKNIRIRHHANKLKKAIPDTVSDSSSTMEN